MGSNLVHQTTQFIRDYVQTGLTNSVNLAFKQLLNFTVLPCHIIAYLTYLTYSKTCLKRSLKNRQDEDLNDK